MHIISRKRLREFWELHADAEEPLLAWFHEAKVARWQTPDEIKKRYGSADVVADNRVIFNIKGNTYRLVVRVNYASGTVFIRFIGTHGEYDRIDATTV